MTRKVANSTELRQAISTATPGDILTIASGVVLDLEDKDLVLPDNCEVIGGENVTILTRDKSSVLLGGPGTKLSNVKIVQETVGNPVVLQVGVSFKKNDNILLNNVSVYIKEAKAVRIFGGSDQLIKGCKFVSESMVYTAIDSYGSNRITFDGNFIRYRTGKSRFTFHVDSSFINNRVEIDGRYFAKDRPETGGIELSYGYNYKVDNNYFEQTDKPIVSGLNDGEMLGAQNSNVPDFAGVGVVTDIGTTIITNIKWGTDKWFSEIHPLTNRKVLYVLTGRARGQWTFVQPGNDGEIIPTNPLIGLQIGDTVALSSTPAYNIRMTNNILKGSRVGIQMYICGLACVVSGNVVMDGGIGFKADTRIFPRTPNTKLQFYPAWFNEISGNALPKGYIYLEDVDVSDTQLPMTFYKNKVVDNAVVDPRKTVVSSLNQVTKIASVGRFIDNQWI